jgi:hypothetical protein
MIHSIRLTMLFLVPHFIHMVILLHLDMVVPLLLDLPLVIPNLKMYECDL